MSNVVPMIPKAIQNALNEYQLATLEAYIDSDPGGLENLRNLARTIPENEIEEAVVNGIIVPFNIQRYRQDTDKSLSEGKWVVMGIFGDETVQGYAYTVGLTNRCHVELFCSGISHNHMGVILNTLGERLIDFPELALDDPYFTEGLFSLADGTPGRTRLQRVPLQSAANNYAYAVNTHIDVKEEHGMIVVIFPDENNILPGEEGYNQDFVQITPEDLADPTPHHIL